MSSDILTPTEDFEHLLLLTGFSLAAHAWRMLSNAGLLDDAARTVLRGHLDALQEKIDAVPDAEHLQVHLDVLIRVLPPSRRADG